MGRSHTITKHLKILLSRSIKESNNKINQINDFLPVYKQELINKREDKLAQLSRKHSKILLPYEINSMGYNYFLKSKEVELNDLKDTHYWNLREIDHRLNSKLQYKVDLAKSIEFLNSIPGLISLFKENLSKGAKYKQFHTPFDYLKMELLPTQNILLKEIIGFLNASNKSIKKLRHKRSRASVSKKDEILSQLNNELEILRHVEYFANQVAKLEIIKDEANEITLGDAKYQKLNKLLSKLLNISEKRLLKNEAELSRQESDDILKERNLAELKVEVDNYRALIKEIEAKYTKENYEKFLLNNNITKVSSNKIEDIIKSSQEEYERLSKEFDQESKTLEAQLIEKNEKLYAAKEEQSRAKIENIKQKLALKNEKMAEYNEEVLVGLQGKLTALKGAYNTEINPQLKLELKEEIEKYENIISLYNPKNNDVLKISNLYMQFGGLKVIKNLSFDIKRGEIFGLIGPNGAGKTTVFNCVTQFYKPTSGDIRFKNSHNEIVNLLELKVHDVIDYGVVRTFQNIELITELTILENMLVGAHKSYRSNLFKQMFHTKSLMEEEKVTRAKALKILEEFGLLEYKDNYPVGLPYGVLKRIEFARTLMLNPELIILDEPAAGLNESETIELTQFIKDVRDKYNVTIFLVEHDMGLVMNVCDRICAISFGEHLITGTPDEVKNDKKVQEAYLGGE